MNEKQIEEIAGIHLIENVGNLVCPGKPSFNKEKNMWVVPIFHASSSAYYRMGEMHIDIDGKVIHVPTGKELTNNGRELLSQLMK